MNAPLLEMRGIWKRFAEVPVLRAAGLELAPGEVHALVGENGAGKSTLMRIAAGILRPDAGTLAFCGRAFAPRSPADALRAGLAMAHQELSLAPDLTVAENILAGLEPHWGWFIAWKELRQRAERMLAQFCPSIAADAPVSSLSLSALQVVEILKTLAWRPKAFVFDEPTSSLDAQESELVLETIRKLKAQSAGIVFISHRMDEVFAIADRITVLRDGAVVGSWPRETVTRQEIVRAMVGRELTQLYPAKADRCGEVLLAVEGCTRRGRFRDVSFVLRRGEILGFCGLVGAGRTELMRAIFGADPLESGRIVLEGKPRRFRSIRQAVQAGVAYVPEDRKQQGLFLDQSAGDNLLCGNLERCSAGGVVRPCRCRELAEEYQRQLHIVGADLAQEVRTLSGGNQQKVLLARWLATTPKVLIADEPTRGIDIGAKGEIHSLLRDFAAAGHGVIVVSSELPELLGLCDRILVMHEGRLAGEVAGRSATECDLIHLATGVGA
jgi:ribose transport system ATP-binding protein